MRSVSFLLSIKKQVIADIGNIDCEKTHKTIIDIMEGGKEAFDKRKLIYTNWNDALKE